MVEDFTGVGMSSFRVTGTTAEVLFGREWVEIWKTTVVENRGDLCVDVDLVASTVKVARRDKPRPTNISRFITDNDIVLFDLENGKVLTLELTPTVNKMLKVLAENGVPFGKGANVTRDTPYRKLSEDV